MRRLPVLIALAAACSAAGEPSAEMFVLEDSAGVEIARNGADAPALSLIEELRLGRLDGPEHLQFFRIGPVLVDGNDHVLVANSGTEVREFTPAGEYVRSVGSAGDGPGEFRNIAMLVASGDTIVIVDGRHLRATWMGPDGSAIRTEPLVLGSLVIYPQARLPDGWLVTVHYFGAWQYEVGRPHSNPVRFAVLDDLRNTAPATPGDPEASPWPVVLRYDRQRVFGIAARETMTANPPLWEPSPAHAVDGAGSVHVSRGSPYRIDVFAPNGQLVRVIRRDHSPVRVTDELWHRYFRLARAYYDTASQRHGEFQLAGDATLGRAGLPRVESLPALGRILVSRDGAVWVERPDLVEDPVRLEWTLEGRQDTFWDVYRPSGRLVGTVRLSSRFTPRAVTGPSVYGVLRDSLDVEHVTRYRIAEW